MTYQKPSLKVEKFDIEEAILVSGLDQEHVNGFDSSIDIIDLN